MSKFLEEKKNDLITRAEKVLNKAKRKRESLLMQRLRNLLRLRMMCAELRKLSRWMMISESFLSRRKRKTVSQEKMSLLMLRRTGNVVIISVQSRRLTGLLLRLILGNNQPESKQHGKGRQWCCYSSDNC